MEQIPQIKDVITARAYALHIASKYEELDLLDTATSVYNWLTKNIALPDILEDFTGELIEMMKDIKKVNKMNEEAADRLLSIQNKHEIN